MSEHLGSDLCGQPTLDGTGPSPFCDPSTSEQSLCRSICFVAGDIYNALTDEWKKTPDPEVGKQAEPDLPLESFDGGAGVAPAFSWEDRPGICRADDPVLDRYLRTGETGKTGKTRKTRETRETEVDLPSFEVCSLPSAVMCTVLQ